VGINSRLGDTEECISDLGDRIMEITQSKQWGRSEKGCGNPLQYACLENPMDRWSLAGYSPWGHKKLDMLW